MVTASIPGIPGTVSAHSDDLLIDWAGPERFERLQRRYGWWGLALIEAIVRLSDIAVSEEYTRRPS